MVQRIAAWWRQSSRPVRFAVASAPALALLISAAAIFRASNGETTTPRRGPILEAIYALGVVKASQVYTLKLGVAAFVAEIPVSEGDLVRKGDVIARTDSTVFRSPLSGVVTQVSDVTGGTVMPGLALLTITDVSGKYLLLSLEQESVLRVKRGLKAEISFESLRGEKLHGTVTRIYPSDNQFFVRIDVDHFPDNVLPDMTADVAIEVERRENALLIPATAVRKGMVRRRRDGRVEETPVRVGVADGEWAEILEGLDPDDEVLLPKR
jgi:membrane fusion protein, macrolide-specific efflux system